MITKAYSIYDCKSEVWSKPFFCKMAGEAIRSFSDACNDEQSPFYNHAGDYTLFEIGSYDDATALLDSNLPTNLGTGDQYKNKSIADAPPFLQDVAER